MKISDVLGTLPNIYKAGVTLYNLLHVYSTFHVLEILRWVEVYSTYF